MLKADLHVHTKYSANPADLLLKKFGTQESYTDLTDVYAQAKARGMDFVTVTDHNVAEGSFKLVELYPKEAFTGVELTAAFPEDGCAVHILVYDFTREQFEQLMLCRHDIYALRDYIKAQKLAYSVAHGTYSVNGKLTLATIEKLILLFDVFECINGTRAQTYNQLLKRVLKSLAPPKIHELAQKYGIAPMSEASWNKAFTGGSDEHAGLFIGETFTMAEGVNKADFLNALRARRTDCGGRSNHYKTQVFTFLKIAYEASKARHQGRRSGKIWDDLCAAIFDGKPLGWKIQLKIEQMKRSRKEKNRAVAHQMSGLVKRLTHETNLSPQERIDLIYNTMAAIEDAFFIMNAEAFNEGFKKGDVVKILSAITALIRSIFLSLPFLGTFRHLHQSSAIMEEFHRAFLGNVRPEEKKILWFSDTVDDLNGVSVTLDGFAREALASGLAVRLAAAKAEGRVHRDYQLELPVVYEYTPDFYPSYTLRFPSLLKSLELIYQEQPTEIIVSTPGPVGLIGILAARLMGIPCRGIYHTDFTRMTELGLSGGSIASLVQGYIRWFYGLVDVIGVPTEETRRMLVQRGHETGRIALFRRGLNRNLIEAVATPAEALRARYGLHNGLTLLYTGRISRDKSVFFLADILKELAAGGFEANLLIAGDGPALEELRVALKGFPRAQCLGLVEHRDLAGLYRIADIFVFPSTMDTFGVSVAEAQAFGVPALVTNAGGPQELIIPGETGVVLKPHDVKAWAGAVVRLSAMMHDDPSKFAAMKDAARARAKECFSWNTAMQDLFS
ncbi:MAG: glycosyltransferase [Candidatus Omnitrophica bacterium]|nr:glycosyltransferase [Candidatus Omnitrophota bacterium]